MRLDGVKLGICEVMGLELDEPRLGSFAGSPERPGLPGATTGQAAPAGAGQLEGDPQGGPAGGPAAEDRRKPPSPFVACSGTSRGGRGCWTGGSTLYAGMTGPRTWRLSSRE